MTKLLLVEDDPMISEIYQRKFTEAGFEVKTADSGEQVLNLAQKEKFDVILLDLVLPKMSGFDVIQHLRDGSFDPTTRIIVSSNLNQREDIDKAMHLGANGFVSKSEYTPSNLVKEIERLLNQFNEEDKNERRLSGNGTNENGQASLSNNSGVPAVGKKILMIEDEQVFLDLFGEKLRQDGYDVKLTDNGSWGLKEALSGEYDLYIIDMVMPSIGGDEIVAKLKLEEKTKDVPIIVLDASLDPDAQKRVESLGVNNFLVKTQLIPSDLSRKVSEILG